MPISIVNLIFLKVFRAAMVLLCFVELFVNNFFKGEFYCFTFLLKQEENCTSWNRSVIEGK